MLFSLTKDKKWYDEWQWFLFIKYVKIINYKDGYALFVNQIITNAMSQGGDSGSLLLNNTNKDVRLLFACSTSYSIFNPISTVLKTLNIKLL